MSTEVKPVNVMALVLQGIQFPVAVRTWLDQSGDTWDEVAERHGLIGKNFSRVINGSAQHPYNPYREALAAELGVTREWLDEQLASVKPE